MLSPKAGITVIISIALSRCTLAVAPVDDSNESIGNTLPEHCFKMLLAVVVIVVNINVVKTLCEVVLYPFMGILILAPPDGAKGNTVVHNSFYLSRYYDITSFHYYATL